MSRTAGLALVVLGCSVACSAGPVERVPPVAETGQDRLADFHIEEASPGGQGSLSEGASLAWVDGGAFLAVTIRGSSSCPRGPGSMVLAGAQRLAIDVVELRPGQEVCSADDAPYVTIVEVPDGLDATRAVTAVFDWGPSWPDDTTTTLAPLD